jgi:pSer/pThr/pTyr-binding forkhead associated (FHA) protein
MPNQLSSTDQTTLLIGGLALLAVAFVVIILFWRMSRQSRLKTAAPPTQPPAPAESTATITPPQPAPSVEITLEFTTDTGQSMFFTLDKPALTVGREADNDICLPVSISDVDTVSKHHARLRRDQDNYVVHDLNSTNGLAVNGRQTIENLLQDGDRLRFGSVEAVFHRPLAGSSSAYRSEPGGAA